MPIPFWDRPFAELFLLICQRISRFIYAIYQKKKSENHFEGPKGTSGATKIAFLKHFPLKKELAHHFWYQPFA